MSLAFIPGWAVIAGVRLRPFISGVRRKSDDIGFLEIIHGSGFDPVASLIA